MPEAKRHYRKGYIIRRRPEKDTIGLGYRVRLSTKKKIEMIAFKNKISQAEVIELLVDKVENDGKIETGMFKVKKKHKLPEPPPPKPIKEKDQPVIYESANLPPDTVYLMVPIKRDEIPKKVTKRIFI